MRKTMGTWLAGGLLLAAAGVAVSGDAAGKALVDKGIQAAGGAAQLTRFQNATWNEAGTYYGMGDGLPYNARYAISRPNQYRMEVDGFFTIVMNGDKGWVQSNGKTTEMPQAQLDAERHKQKAGLMSTLVPLGDKAYTLKTAGSGKVGDQEARIVEASRPDYPTVKLFFDAKTDLLIRSAYLVKAPDLDLKEVMLEATYSDFRNVDGARLPHKIVLTRDGKRFVEAEFSNLKGGVQHTASIFDAPK
jgi:outer membrane lipoprotein-sorting protein